MSWSNGKKEGFKKCRSATFSIDGFSFTIGRRHLFHSRGVCACVMFSTVADLSLLTLRVA